MFFNRKLRKYLSEVSFRLYDHVYRNFDDYFRVEVEGNGYFLEWLNPEFSEVVLINKHFRNLRTPANTRLTYSCTDSVKQMVDDFTEYAKRFVEINRKALEALEKAPYLRKYDTLWYEGDTIYVHLTPYDVEEYIEMVRANTSEDVTDLYIEKYKEDILRRMAKDGTIIDADHPELDFVQYEYWLNNIYLPKVRLEKKNEECKETIESIRNYKKYPVEPREVDGSVKYEVAWQYKTSSYTYHNKFDSLDEAEKFVKASEDIVGAINVRIFEITTKTREIPQE